MIKDKKHWSQMSFVQRFHCIHVLEHHYDIVVCMGGCAKYGVIKLTVSGQHFEVSVKFAFMNVGTLI